MLLDYSGISQSYVGSGRSLDWAASLRVMLIMRTRKMQVDDTSVPDWILNNKIKAYEFIDRLGFKRPRVIKPSVWLENIAPLNQVVIKPYNGAGSRGVYLVFNEKKIYHVKSRTMLESWNSLLTCMQEDLATEAVRENRWIIERLILEDGRERKPARDLKFYCFYGQVVLVLEVVRYPDTAYCFWSRDGTRTETGAYIDESFDGVGFTDHMLKIAESISLQIPSPFIRIDFHSTGSDLVFCEFTPRPGGAWLYSKKVDEQLGDAYLAAEGRLLNDLLTGKKFDAFCSMQ
jgi:hypothetical protein